MNELVKDKCRTAYKRLFEIDWLIRAGKYPAAAKIAEKLEVSKRTVQRDLRYMEMVLSAPLAYSAERHGYIYRWSDFSLSDFFLYSQRRCRFFLLRGALWSRFSAGLFILTGLRMRFFPLPLTSGKCRKWRIIRYGRMFKLRLQIGHLFQRQKRLFRQWTIGLAFTA